VDRLRPPEQPGTERPPKKILMLMGDFDEDYEVMVAFQALQIVDKLGPATRLDVQVQTPAVRHEVTVQQIQRWLEGASISPNEMLRKAKLKAMLGQM
jgi:hypothetical protein